VIGRGDGPVGDVHSVLLVGYATRGYATRVRAAAGRSRAARQPPNDPASRPPAMASSSARTVAVTVTEAGLGTAMVVWVAAGANMDAPPGPPATCVEGPAPPPADGTLADSFGAIVSMMATPARPRPTPSAPPMMPMPTDSPSTWLTIRLLRQPSAL